MKRVIRTGDIVITSDIEDWPLYTIIGQLIDDVNAFSNRETDSIDIIASPTHVNDMKSTSVSPKFVKLPMDKIVLLVGRNHNIREEYMNVLNDLIVDNQDSARLYTNIRCLESSDIIKPLFDRVWKDPKVFSQFDHVVFRDMDRNVGNYVYSLFKEIKPKDIQKK